MSTPTLPAVVGPRPPGRPSLLSRDVRDRLLAAIRTGATRRAAAASAGIGLATFHRWLERGQHARSGEYRDFRDAVRQADAHAEYVLLRRIARASRTDWRAAAWILERRFPHKYGADRDARRDRRRETPPAEVVFTLDLTPPPAPPHLLSNPNNETNA